MKLRIYLDTSVFSALYDDRVNISGGLPLIEIVAPPEI